MSQPKVGFIGLGIMGAPMARNLLKAGYSLTVYNRTRSKMNPLIEEGAQGADSPAEVARNSEIIITIVSDTPDVEEVIAGEKGVLDGIQPNSLVIDMSTISPDTERELDEKLRKKSCSLVDAPVSGGDVGAQKGTLAIMAGGREEDFERARPLFEAMGKTITYCGPVGNGQTTKLCNQILVSVNLLGVCEALVFARKNGLDPRIMVEAVSGGAAGSWQLSNLGPRIVDRDFAPGFMVDLMQKDLRIVLQTADLSGSVLPAAAIVHQLFNSVQSQGGGRDGTQALARALEALASVES
ncbi:MAG TPA: NAD(P)-dependent oxidoreductase [Acidobacteriota bacterium]|nr:NAD(P)-dependent oxidoreductase [Acidobacteriota bacterium]